MRHSFARRDSSACGVFPYSLEPGTPAERLPDHLPEEVKKERRDRLMEMQQEIAFAWSRPQVGREIEVIVDGPDPEVPGHCPGPRPGRRPGHRLHGPRSRARTCGPATWSGPRSPAPTATISRRASELGQRGEVVRDASAKRREPMAAISAPLLLARPRHRQYHPFMATAPPQLPSAAVFNLPNGLTLARLGLAVVLFACIAAAWWLTGLIVFIVAAFTDWLDGYLARKHGSTAPSAETSIRSSIKS